MLKRTTYLQEPSSAPAKSNGTSSRMNRVQDVLGKGWEIQMVSSFPLRALYSTDQFAERAHLCEYDYRCDYENITISQLAFRQQSKTDDAELINYLQN